MTITADVTVPAKASGVMLVQGGDFGGWTFYMKDGTPSYTYNWLGMEQFNVVAKQKVPAGQHTLKLDFAYEGGGGGKGGIASIFMDGTKIGEGKIAKTQGGMFGVDETADVGVDQNTPVNPAYKGKSKFTGKINKITVEVLAAKQ